MSKYPLLIIYLTLLLAAVGYGQRPSIDLLEVKFLYDKVEFEQAIEVGQKLLQGRSSHSKEELAFLHRYLGLSWFNIGETDSSRYHFLTLLSLAPDTELDPVETSPKILDFFATCREAYVELQGSDQTVAQQYVFVNDSRPAAAWRSAILPGWGQFHKRQSKRGYVIGGAFWGTLAAGGIALVAERRARDDYLAADGPATEFEDSYNRYNTLFKTRRNLFLAAAILWAVNVGDALWSDYPQPRVTADQDAVQLTLTIPLR